MHGNMLVYYNQLWAAALPEAFVIALISIEFLKLICW